MKPAFAFSFGAAVSILRCRCKRRLAGAAGLEPVTSAVTGQRSNQLSYAPARGSEPRKTALARQAKGFGNIRAADAKEVGVGNPAEETYRHPNQNLRQDKIVDRFVKVHIPGNMPGKCRGGAPAVMEA